MTETPSILDLQVQSIVENLRRQRESRCRQLVSQAEREAGEVIRRNRQRYYDRGRQAINEERRRREKALLQAQRRIHAAESHRTQARYGQLLSDGWPKLTAALVSRWSDPESRNAWCEMLLDEALAVFGRAELTIAHPATWSAEDAHGVSAYLKARGASEPSFGQDSAITAGLRIVTGTAVLDGTIDGLLADRALVEGYLLAAWEDEQDG